MWPVQKEKLWKIENLGLRESYVSDSKVCIFPSYRGASSAHFDSFIRQEGQELELSPDK